MPVLNYEGRNYPLSTSNTERFARVVYHCEDCSRDTNRDVWHVDPDPQGDDADELIAELGGICGCEIQL